MLAKQLYSSSWWSMPTSINRDLRAWWEAGRRLEEDEERVDRRCTGEREGCGMGESLLLQIQSFREWHVVREVVVEGGD